VWQGWGNGWCIVKNAVLQSARGATGHCFHRIHPAPTKNQQRTVHVADRIPAVALIHKLDERDAPGAPGGVWGGVRMGIGLVSWQARRRLGGGGAAARRTPAAAPPRSPPTRPGTQAHFPTRATHLVWKSSGM